jgi:hypothetical protein
VALPGQEALILDPAYRLSDSEFGHGCTPGDEWLLGTMLSGHEGTPSSSFRGARKREPGIQRETLKLHLDSGLARYARDPE